MNDIQNIPLAGALDGQVTIRIAKLALIIDLLDSLHHFEIKYCHWKSNEHLTASMTGDTDLDILFDVKQKEQIVQLLQGLGFKLLQSIRQKQYKDIEDYIGLDFQTGKVVHVHAHFQLTMGETYLKGYQLRLEDKILNTRVYDQELGIYTSDPAIELVLLFFREALKLRHRDLIKISFGIGINYTGNIRSEYKWLRKRVTDVQLKAVLSTIFENPAPIYSLLQGDLNRKQLVKLAPLLKKEFEENRLYSPSNALILRWYREATVTVFKALSRALSGPYVSQRINPRGGLTVAIVGADGSGKSTVTASLHDTFKEKLDVYKIYFGRGDGSRSFARKMLFYAKKAFFSVKHSDKELPANQPFIELKKGMAANVYRCVEALLVAFEKRQNLRRMHLAKNKGMLVICDRFPQNQLMGYNDGPLLSHLAESPNPFYRISSKKEAAIYSMINNSPPDLLMKLIAAPEIVESRKPGETSLEMLQTKIAGIRQLQFAATCKVITLDAAQPLSCVLYQIRKELWDAYL